MMDTALYSNGHLTNSISTSLSSRNSTQDACKNRPKGEFPGLLQGVMESLIDGVMLLTDQGELLFANGCAQRICHQLTENFSLSVPRQVWRSCQALIKGRQEFPEHSIIIEDEIKTEEANAIRLRAQWLYLNTIERPCLLVTLEDRQQSAQYKAIAEAQRYGLTERETQVWMLKQAGHTYKAISHQLHIAEDTVKKHIKSIHSKRDGVEWLEEG
jgi:DNA-binding CsgD family transcriptional regulator